MPTGTSPGGDILKAILDNIGPIVVILLIILGSIGKAMKSGGARPPTGMPRSVPPPMAPPTTIPRPTPPSMAPPTTIPRPSPAPLSVAAPPQPAPFRPAAQAAPPRPVSQPKFRPPAAPAARQASNALGSSSQQLAQERADIERFVLEEKQMEADEPAALGVALTSPAAPGPAPNPLFTGEGPTAGTGPSASMLRAIMLAQALGPPRMRAHRRRDSRG